MGRVADSDSRLAGLLLRVLTGGPTSALDLPSPLNLGGLAFDPKAMTEIEQKARAVEGLRAAWVREVEVAAPVGIGDVAQAHRDLERWMAPLTRPLGGGLVLHLTGRGLDEVARQIMTARVSLEQAESQAFLALGLDLKGWMEAAKGVRGDWAMVRLGVENLLVREGAVEDWYWVEQSVLDWQAEVWMAWSLGASVEPEARVTEYKSWMIPNVT